MLPQGFTRVEYIESTGTQYIDTGFKPNQNTRIVMDAIPMSVGGASGDCGMFFGSGYPVQQKGFEAYAFGGMVTGVYNGVQKDGSAVSAGQRVVIDFNKNVCKITADGKVVLNHTFAAATFASAVSLALFVLPRQSRYYGRVQMHRCQIYDNGTLVRDYIPCQTDTGEVGLYDMETAEFFGNDGTGEFIAGPEVTVLDDPNTLLLLHGEDLTDASQYARVLTNSGVTVSDAQSKFGGKSLYFNGQAKILLDAIDFGDEDFTVDWWEYVTSSASSARFCTQYTTETASIKLGGILLGFAGTAVYASSDISTGAWDLISGVNMFSNTLNTWVHWAAVRSGTTFTTYRNGVKFATANISGAIVCDEQYKTVIGDYRAGDEEPFIGYLDEFRISDVARWTADFVPPDEPYGTPETAPDAPESLEYTQAGGVVSLTWSASSGAETYRVYRDGALIVETEATEYTDTVAESPAAHLYAVTAVNEFGESALSEPVRADIWGDTAPELICDRTQADVDDAKALISKYMRGEVLDGYEQEMWERGLRGCYNTSDVNRVEYHTRELQNILNANGYNIHIDTRLWAKPDIMRYSDIVRYLGNIETILDAFGRSANAPELPSIDMWIDYVVANDIEKILYVTRELIYGALAMFRRSGTFTAGNDYVTQVIRRA